MKIWTEPKISFLASQVFHLPEHIEWDIGDREMNGETLSEFAGRLCYLSFGTGEMDGHKTVAGRTDQRDYFENVLKVKHGSVLEHAVYTFLFEGVSRSLTHELVRHRAGWGFSQLSQRFVEETNVGFVVPPLIQRIPGYTSSIPYITWLSSCACTAQDYSRMLITLTGHHTIGGATLDKKRIREAARSILPNCTETKIVVTANARAWRHFIEMRGSPLADMEMIRLAEDLAEVIRDKAPSIFQDVQYPSGIGVEVLHSKV
jgi:thymidylate synthase (FAD)